MPTVDTLPYAPWRERGTVVDGEFRWRLGARPLDLDRWIEFGPDAVGPDGWIAHKRRLHVDQRDTVFVVGDDVEEDSAEILDALVDHLSRPDLDVPSDVRERARHRSDRHPLEEAAHLVPDDLVVMVERDGRLVVGGGSVCFPNRWDLRSKLGSTMSEVHGPVADLNDQLGSSIDRFLERLTPDRSWWRLGWGIIDVPDGYTPLDGTGPPRPQDPSASELFVRVERETLRRFPNTGCVLFTIRTYIAPIASVLAHRESGEELIAAVTAMSPVVREYKDLVDHVVGLAALSVRP